MGDPDIGRYVDWTERVSIDPAGPTKADLWRGERLFAGLNCLAAGQEQRLHTHAEAEKLYLVLRGRGAFVVGGELFEAGEGAMVPAPAGVPHGVRNGGGEPLVLLTFMAPPPRS